MSDETPTGGERNPPDILSAADWARVLRLAHDCVRRHLRFHERGEAQDLALETMIRVLRAIEHRPPDNIDALTTEIARRTCADFIRRKRRRRTLDEMLRREPTSLSPSPHDGSGDVRDRIAFVVLTFFRADEGTRCGELAQAIISGIRLKDYAASAGRTPEAVRQEWKRCCTKLRAAAERGGPLWEWLWDGEENAP